MNHSNDSSNTPVRTNNDEVVRTEVVPSEALNRFAPPDGFVPASTDLVTENLRYGFRVANFSLLIRDSVGSEVVPMMPIAMIPTSPSWLKGIINLRGNLVPVCDLAQMLRSDSHVENNPMILVLDKGEQAAGFIINGYPQALIGLTKLNQLPVLPDVLARYVESAYTFEDEIWLEFDYEGLLLHAE